MRQQDESLFGAHYAGAIAEHKYPDKVVVRYYELYEGDEEDAERGGAEAQQQPLVEEEKLAHLRPVPPPTEDDNWAAELSPGAAVDLKHEGGWWGRVFRTTPAAAELVAYG